MSDMCVFSFTHEEFMEFFGLRGELVEVYNVSISATNPTPLIQIEYRSHNSTLKAKDAEKGVIPEEYHEVIIEMMKHNPLDPNAWDSNKTNWKTHSSGDNACPRCGTVGKWETLNSIANISKCPKCGWLWAWDKPQGCT